MVVSASKTRADDFSTFTLRLINEMPILAHLKPGPDQRNSKVAFDVGPARASHAPSVKSVGITGQMAGSRADYIIGDDIEIPNNSATEAMRLKLSETVKEFDAVLKPKGRVIYLGTPQTEMSLYNKLPPRGYEIRIWPARYPDEKRLEKYGTKLCPKVHRKILDNPQLTHRSIDPVRFTDEDLMEREASYGRSGFALQFMLDTSLSDAEKFPLKVSDLLIMDVDVNNAPEKVVWGRDPKQVIEDVVNVAFDGDRFYRPMALEGTWQPYTGSVMVIDPSGRGQDETGVCVANMLNSQIFIPFLDGLKGGYSEEVLEKIATTARDYKVNMILVESNFGDGMFSELLKPYLRRIYPVAMEEVRHSKQKELRIIDTLEPVMNQHRLIIDKKIIERDSRSLIDMPPEEALQYQLIYQMTRVTRERRALAHDDRLDTLAIAVAYWVEAMASDQDDEIDDRRLEDLHRDVEQILNNSKPDWVTIVPGRSVDSYAEGSFESENVSWFD